MTLKPHQFVPNQDNNDDRTQTQPEPRHLDMTPDQDLFGGYFENWLGEQTHDLEALVALIKAKPKPELTQSVTEWTRSVSELVNRVMGHYERYYRVKSESVKKDAVQMMTPAWRSNLEDSFSWIGGWRPSMAFHLLYSVSGIQLEAGLSQILSGLATGDLADLSPSQLDRVDELQRQTIKSEKNLTESLATHQETVADSSMVELSHLATELTRYDNSMTQSDSVNDRVDSVLEQKGDKLEEILTEADNLRLKTLKDTVDILNPLNPTQAAHFLIAAAELHLRVHEWGTKKDDRFNDFVRPGTNGGIGS